MTDKENEFVDAVIWKMYLLAKKSQEVRLLILEAYKNKVIKNDRN